MLTDAEKAQIRACMLALQAGVEGFHPRQPQLKMIATVATALAQCRDEEAPSEAGPNIAVVEAGTGTGKSFGALVPALVMARSRGRRLVVSTSTVALQNQYAEKDAPTLARLGPPFSFTFAVAKGRRRYACTAKLNGEAADASQHELDLHGADVPLPAETAALHRRRTIVIALAESFESGCWTGDRDELAVPVSDDIWSSLSTDRLGCSGSRCAEFERCPFYAARQKVKDADLVIANHDLVLAALSMEVGSVLPHPSKTIYVFDEAHSLAAKAVDHLSARHALRGAQEWLRDATDAVRDAVLAMRLDEALLRDACAAVALLTAELELLWQRVHGLHAFDTKTARRFQHGQVPPWWRASGERIVAAGRALEQTFAGVREALLQWAPSEGFLAARVLSALGFFVGKLDKLLSAWDLMLADDVEGEAPVARWIELHEDSGGAPDYLVCAAPISGSDWLRGMLWNRASGAVLMSATLTSCGSFESFLRQSGLSVYAACTCCKSSRHSTIAATPRWSFPRCAPTRRTPLRTRRRSWSGCQLWSTRAARWCSSPRRNRCGMCILNSTNRCARSRCCRAACRSRKCSTSTAPRLIGATARSCSACKAWPKASTCRATIAPTSSA